MVMKRMVCMSFPCWLDEVTRYFTKKRFSTCPLICNNCCYGCDTKLSSRKLAKPLQGCDQHFAFMFHYLCREKTTYLNLSLMWLAQNC